MKMAFNIPIILCISMHFLTTAAFNTYKSGDKEHSSGNSLLFEGVAVPVYKFRGEDAPIGCRYEQREDTLYSVQWYKDDMEFYRYKPRNKPPKKVFDLAGVNVDMNHSDQRHVLLRNLSFNSTGTYRCEVSSDAPHFRTYTDTSRMVVVELPKHPPKISGHKSQYVIGEPAFLNCTSARSQPAAQLKWFINGDDAPEEYLRPYRKSLHDDGLESIRLSLLFTVLPEHFQNGEMALLCQATVSTIYVAANEQDREE